MASIKTERLRNLALLSHSGAGKTTLCEALLFSTGAITRMGRVEDGNTVSDYEPEEVKRTSSIQTSIIPCLWKDHKVNFLDTPGYDDFLGEVLCALRVVDGAVLVVAAPSGVEVGTERAWNLCEERKLPRILFVNKMDRENADFFRALASIQAAFGRHCVPLQVPIGSQQQFNGVVDLLSPNGQLDSQAAEARERLVEAIAETDDDLATKYLEGETLSPEDIATGLRRGILSGKIVPVLAGAATQNLGVKELLDAAIKYLPSPKEGAKVTAVSAANKEPVELEPNPTAPLVAQVFKTTADPYVGRLSYFRVFQGTLKSDSQVWNVNKEQTERIGQLFIMRGKNQEPTSELVAGDIGAVAKLSVTATGDTVCQREAAVLLEGFQFPVANYTMAVYPKSKADVDKMSAALARLLEEDPCLKLTREPDTGETLLSGLGDTHLETAVEKVRRKFGADLLLQVPKVPYKETITVVTQAEYKHKKQTGGHGQYGHVLLRLEPLARGEGYKFGDEVVGGRVPKEYIPSVEKGVQKALAEGVIAGYPVTDVKVVLYDGSYHEVDSSGISFEIAGSYALRKGVSQANPVLLEPVMKLTITVPEGLTGEVMGDLNSRRGRILGMVPAGGSNTIIEAEAPQAEVIQYATVLRSMTQGRGSFKMEFVRYEEVPPHLAQRIIDESKKARASA